MDKKNKQKVCCKCGCEFLLWEYDSEIYCEDCLQDELDIEERTIYSADDEYWDSLDSAFDDYGAKEIK